MNQTAINIKPEQLAAYIQALQGQDWSFEMADDHSKWRAGKDSMDALRMMRQHLDPDFMVWNQFAPIEWQVKSASPLSVTATSSGRRPFCRVCNWRKGGPDSWNGRACKCGYTEPPISMVDEGVPS